jgi:hypothetical protein
VTFLGLGKRPGLLLGRSIVSAEVARPAGRAKVLYVIRSVSAERNNVVSRRGQLRIADREKRVTREDRGSSFQVLSVYPRAQREGRVWFHFRSRRSAPAKEHDSQCEPRGKNRLERLHIDIGIATPIEERPL